MSRVFGHKKTVVLVVQQEETESFARQVQKPYYFSLGKNKLESLEVLLGRQKQKCIMIGSQ